MDVDYSRYYVVPGGYDGEIGIDHGWTHNPLDDDQCTWHHDFDEINGPSVAEVLRVIAEHEASHAS